jgi:hypothetical protein
MHECFDRRLAGGGSMQCMSVWIGGWWWWQYAMHECLDRRLAGGGSMQCMSVWIGGWWWWQYAMHERTALNHCPLKASTQRAYSPFLAYYQVASPWSPSCSRAATKRTERLCRRCTTTLLLLAVCWCLLQSFRLTPLEAVEAAPADLDNAQTHKS